MEPAAPWERQPEESAKAYAAFCAYRDLGTSRSLDAAFRTEYPNRTGRASGHWQRWASANDWVRRAEAYDAHLEREARRGRERAHVEDLETYRERQRAIAQRQYEASAALHEFAQQGLAKYREKYRDAMLPPGTASELLKRAAELAESASSAEAIVLGLDILLKELKHEPA